MGLASFRKSASVAHASGDASIKVAENLRSAAVLGEEIFVPRHPQLVSS